MISRATFVLGTAAKNAGGPCSVRRLPGSSVSIGPYSGKLVSTNGGNEKAKHSPLESPILNSQSLFQFQVYAAPIARRCWKHSLQNTGRPCVGRNGTVVSFPHWEQFVFVSVREGEVCPPPLSARFALQALHRFGSFLNPLSAKNICSPAVNTNSAPHSAHFNTLSWYSMSRSPLVP